MTTHIKITAVYREPADLERLIAALVLLAAEPTVKTTTAQGKPGGTPPGRAA
jgi:hypothetical protein